MEEQTDIAAIDPSKVPMCKCLDAQGQPSHYAIIKISKTEKNPGREFFSCHLSKAQGGCGYFAFADQIYTDPKTGLARRKYVANPTAVTASSIASDSSALQERISVLEQTVESLKLRIQKLEDDAIVIPSTPEHELPPAKSQKTMGTSQRGRNTRPKILP
jgi:hypothetical protein